MIDAYLFEMDSDSTFLAQYDPADFPPLAVAVDVVVLTFDGADLRILLVPRREQPARGRLALPGTFVRIDEDLAGAARRALLNKAGLDAPVRQFHAFGDVDRDPRMRIVSIGYMALLPIEMVRAAMKEEHALLTIAGGVIRLPNGRRAALPFDHAAIIARALSDLRRDLDRDDWAFGLLDEMFSLRELQALHEAVRGETLNKPAFRKRLLDSGRLEATGQMETGKGFRPAELYRARRTGEEAR